MNKSSFVFYKDWKKAIECLPDDIRLEIYESIIEYATTGDLRGLKPMANVAFNFIKTDIDRDTEKYMSVIERNKHNGNKGGRPKKNPNNPVGFLETQRNPKNPIMIMIMIMMMMMKREGEKTRAKARPPQLPTVNLFLKPVKTPL